MGRFDFKEEYGKIDSTGKFVQMGRFWLHLETGKLIPIIQGGGPPNTIQNRFAFGDDDGTESGHTLDTENVDRGVQAGDVTFLIRFQVEETNGKDDPWTFQLYAQKNGAGGYTAVTTARTDGLRLANDTQSRADNSVTTERLTAGSGSWLAGLYDDGQTQNGMGSVLTPNGQYIDLEFAIEIDSGPAQNDDYWDLQVYSNTGTALDSYTVTPRVTADLLDPVEVTPSPAVAGADSINPTIKLSSVSVTPAMAAAGADSVDPTVGGLTGVALTIDFEEGDKTDFDSEEAAAQMTVSEAAALVGTYGLAGVHDGAGLDFGGINALTITTETIRFRFYMEDVSLSMTDADSWYVVMIKTDGSLGGVADLVRVRVAQPSGTIIILVAAGNDDDTDEVTSSVTLPTGSFYAEVLLTRATTNSAADGEVTLWVNGSIVGSTITTIDNYDLWPTIQDTFFGGDSSDPGTSGTIYLDDLIIRDDATEIGSAGDDVDVSPAAASASADSLIGSVTPKVLPVTITSGSDLSAQLQNVGPFQDANNNLYIILRNSTNDYTLEMWKSSDGGQTWAEVDSGNHPLNGSSGNVAGVDVFQDGATLHIANMTADEDVWYHSFNTSDNGTTPDEWVVVDKSVVTYTSTASERSATIAVQSDGDIIIFSNAEDGTYFAGRECVEYHYSDDDGATWNTGNSFGATDSDNIVGPAVIGESDKIHAVWKEEAANQWNHRSLVNIDSAPSASEGLDGSGTYDESDFNYTSAHKLVYYDDGGVERITFVALDNTGSNDTPWSTIIEDDGTPDTPEQVTTTKVHRGMTNFHSAAMTLCVDQANKTVYLVFADLTTQDIYIIKNVDDGGWTGETEIWDGVTADLLSANLFIREDGDTVIGCLIDDGGPSGTTKYTEYVVVEAVGDVNVSPSAVAAGADSIAPEVSIGEVFHITFEGDNLNEFDSVVDADGDLNTQAAAALEGNFGVEGVLDDSNLMYGVMDASIGTFTPDSFSYRFYIDPNDLLQGGTDRYFGPIQVFNALGDTISDIVVEIRASGIYVNLETYDDDDTRTEGSEFLITDKTLVEVLAVRATSDVASDGYHSLFINGELKHTVSGRDCYDVFTDLDYVRMGVTYASLAGVTGSVYLDDYIFRDDGEYIGGEIFHITHEGGNLNEWDTESDPDNDLDATTDAALVGSWGLALIVDDQVSAQMIKDVTGSGLTKIGVRFYFDTNNITMADNDSMRIGQLRCGGSPISYIIDVHLNRNSGNYRILGQVRNDANSNILSQYVIIDDGPHFVEVYTQRATSDVASDGEAAWWVDGVAKNTASSVDNYDAFADIQEWRSQIGAVDVGTSGTIYIDDIIARDDGQYIGSVDENITPAAAVAGADSVDPGVEQDDLAVSPVAVAAGADSVGPAVRLGSVSVTPSVSVAGADSVDPSVQQDSLNVSPAASVAGADSIDPSVEQDSLALSPTLVSAGADSVDPTTQLGNINITPSVAVAGADSIDPTIEADFDFTPAVAVAGADSIDPSVRLGSVNVLPSVGAASADSIDPTVQLGDVSVSPALSDASAVSIDPTVEIATADVNVSPAASDAATVASIGEVRHGSLSLSPTLVDAGADSIDPTIENFVTLTPAVAEASADSIDPSVTLGLISITPAVSEAGADSVDPSVLQDSLALSPTESASGADSLVGEARQGSLPLSPDVAESGVDSVNPTVQVGDLSLSPAVAEASAVSVDPTVDVGGDVNVSPSAVAAGADSLIGETRQGSVSVSPTLVDAGADSVDPTTNQGDLDITAAVADASAVGVDPTVDIEGGGEDVSPAAVSAGADSVDPSILFGSLSASPAAATAATETTLLDVQEGEGITPDPAGAGTDTSVVIVGGNNRLIISFARVLIPVGSNLQVFPEPAAAGADSVSPSLYFTSISVSPTAVTAGTDTVDPTVGFTDVEVTPAAAVASADSIDPTVFHSSTSYSPAAAVAGADSIDPTFQYGSISTQALTNANVRTVSVDPTVTGGFTFTPAAATAATDTVDPTVVHGDFSRTPEPVSAGTDTVEPSLHWSSHSSTLAPAVAGTVASIGEVAESGAQVTPAPASAATASIDPDVLQIGMLVSTDPASAGTDAHLDSVVQGGGFLDVYPVENYTQASASIGEVRVDPAAPAYPAAATAEAHTDGPTVQFTGGGVDVYPAPAYAQAAVPYQWFQVRIGSVSITPAPATAGADTVLGEARQHTLWLAPWVKYAVAVTVGPTVRLGSVSVWKPPAVAKTDTTLGSAQYGSLDLSPAAATASTSVVDPTILVQGGYTAVSPALVAVRAVSIDPAVQLGSISITPAPAAATAAVAVGVILQFSTVDVYPAALSAGTRVVGPRVGQLAMALYPAAASASTDAIAPTVFLGPEEVSPYRVLARCSVTGPTVGLSGHSVTPGAAVAAASAVDPDIYFGGINVSPAAASAIVVSVIGEVLVLDNLYPELDVVIGTWTDKNEGTTGLFDSLDERPDPDDTDYIMNETPEGEVYRADMDEGVDPGRDDHHYVEYRVSKDNPLTQIDLTVTLKEGVTVIATWTHIDIDVAPVTIKQTLTTLQASNITNYSDLYLEFDAVEV